MNRDDLAYSTCSVVVVLRRPYQWPLESLPIKGKQRQVHGDDDGTDRHAEEADEYGLDQGQQFGDGGVPFLFIEVGNLAQHRIRRAGASH